MQMSEKYLIRGYNDITSECTFPSKFLRNNEGLGGWGAHIVSVCYICLIDLIMTDGMNCESV